jgi:anti-sigma factor RsiW
MNDRNHQATTSPEECAPSHEERVQLYLDGEMPFSEQPALFAHLAVCDACRRTMDGVLTFRRMSRQEFLHVPPAADDVFFERLAQLKQRSDRVDRAAERRPLWHARRAVSLRSAVLTAIVVFMVGVFLPANTPEESAAVFVEIEEELVEFPAFQFPFREPTAVYVFYPGLTIEAPKSDDYVEAL